MGAKCCSFLSGRPLNEERQPFHGVELRPTNSRDDDELQEPSMQQKHSTKPRKSVSAEAYGDWNKRVSFTPPTHEKSAAQEQRLERTMNKSLLFNKLDTAEFNKVLKAMKEVHFEVGKDIIEEGDDGDCLFILETGLVDCIKDVDGEQKVVKTCSSGDVFGELALLYNCPRAATVRAKDDCHCWQLDRASFNNIVRDAAVQRRENYDEILKQVPILRDVSAYERSQLADALVLETYSKGDLVVKQGDPGECFFIIEQGTLYVEKKNASGSGSTIVKEYSSGDYFGELALLKSKPRAASVLVSSDSARLLSLGQDAFVRLLCGITNELEQQASSYIQGADDDQGEQIAPLTSDESFAAKRSKRKSVSAEAFGEWNKKEAFTPPSYAKTDQQTQRLKATLNKSFMFSGLEPNYLDTILLAMQENKFDKSTVIISEGDDGDCLFVMEAGQVECVKDDKVVRTCQAGDVFGELALLYNCPRAATVRSKDATTCWQLDRSTFNHIVKDAAVKRREGYDRIFQTVPILQDIDMYERSQVADVLEVETFARGDVVVKEGDEGDKFYIVQEGELSAEKSNEAGPVKDFVAGDYFGELALLRSQPRAATVTVKSESVRLLSLERDAFDRLLGGLHSDFDKRAAAYDVDD